MAISFNRIPILSVFASCIVGFLISPLMILVFVFLMGSSIWKSIKLEVVFKKLISVIIKIIIKIAKIGGNLPLGKTYVVTPKLYFVLLYYLVLAIRIVFILYISK